MIRFQQEAVDTRDLKPGEVVVSPNPPEGTWRHCAYWRLRPDEDALPLPLWLRIDAPQGVCIGWRGEEGPRWAVALSLDDLRREAGVLDGQVQPNRWFVRAMRWFRKRPGMDIPIRLRGLSSRMRAR